MNNQLTFLIRRWFGRIFFLLIALLVGAFVLNSVLIARDNRRFPPPGDLVDIGGHQLHIWCQGTGRPTVIVDNGAADWSISWWGLQAQIAEQTRICTYDRAGLGWSEAGQLPRTSDVLVAELETLLVNADIEPPYVLAGHSLGGYNVRLFAERNPEMVAGIVFVEAAHPEQWERFPERVNQLLAEQVDTMEIGTRLAPFGLLRLAPLARAEMEDGLQPAYVASMVRPKAIRAAWSEVGNGAVSATQAARVTTLGDLPIAVVTGAESFETFRPMISDPDFPYEEANEVWMILQTELAQLSSNSRHFVSPTANHDINFTDPELVIEAIMHVVEATR